MALTAPDQGRPRPGRHPQPGRRPLRPANCANVGVMIRERHLFGPGPSNPYPEATARPRRSRCSGTSTRSSSRSWTRPATCSARVWGTDNARTLPLSATGSAGMEAAFVNTVAPRRRRRGRGQRALRPAHVRRRGPLRRRGRRASSTSGASRSTSTACSPRTRAPAIIAAVHAETSTGVRSDIAALGAGKGDALLLADAVTSHRRHRAARRRLGHRRRLRRHPEVPRRRPRPGAVHDQRPRLRAPRREAPQSWYLDLGLLGGYVGEAGGKGGSAPTTTPRRSAMVASLHAGLGRILDEGLEAVWARHAEAGRRLQDGLEEMGLELFAAEGCRLPRADHRPACPTASTRPPSAATCSSARHRDRRRRRRVRRHACGGSA